MSVPDQSPPDQPFSSPSPRPQADPALRPVAAAGHALGGVLTVGGLCGLLREAFGWWPPLMGFLRHLAPAGYEIYSFIIMIAVGLVLVAAASSTSTRHDHG
ncbi:hypothetical protein Ga0074812_107310 [Parafrankia irregularis]|uniref:Uncharacterized protein n=1 Tax=Parafrankia irregularis TaxID=795642 RepID=A0A0S4QPK6_9ACTN|nr:MULTISPECIES: hypothetical protein [Parafrankia]MBE3201144.1 hypothetical protein [Parafrankia sp. CH37]CUU56426.1 hypothetical protein Ga0074812_107310 [Parafrankia irregularis]